MSSQPASMAEAVTPGAKRPYRGLPEEIVIWEILVRLDPKSLLRCGAVRHAWRDATSTRDFLLAHHARQPALSVASDEEYILAFDHRAAAAQLDTVAQLDKAFNPEDSCDGLLVLSRYSSMSDTVGFSVCNLATRQYAPLRQLPAPAFRLLGMYSHRPTGEYRLLLERGGYNEWPEPKLGCYVFALGFNQPPRYIGEQEAVSWCFDAPVRVRDSLHWYPVYYPSESDPPEHETERNLVIVFDTISESFRQMRAPVIPTNSYIFDMGDMLGIYSCNKATGIVDIWVLQIYESEVWDLNYRVELPIAEINGKHEDPDGNGNWYVIVALGDGDVLLLVSFGHWLFYVDADGELVASFQDFFAYRHRLKQTLVPHDFFTTLEGYAVDASPFM